MRTSIAAAAIALLTACSPSTSPQPASVPEPAPQLSTAASGPCTRGFVEIAVGTPACGIALEANGSLTLDGRRTQPIVVSYQEGADGKVALPAREVVLFPPSPQHGLRVIQACETADGNSLCWATRLLDPKSAKLHDIVAGKYGPSHWIRWSPAERRVALISRNEGAEWLHIVDAATGVATTYPSASESVNWQIERDTFAWTGDDAFSVKVKTCDYCGFETRSFTLP
ncbi:hypothetical protein [Dongia sp. agr-C8]